MKILKKIIKSKGVVIGMTLVLGIIFSGVLVWSNFAKGAPNYLSWINDDWSQANSYDSKDPLVKTNDFGEVKISTESSTIAFPTDNGFQGRTNNVTSTGSGQSSTLELAASITDPFAGTLGEWRALPSIPEPGKFTRYTRMGDYIYCVFGSGDGTAFARISITSMNAPRPTSYMTEQNLPQWEFLARIPVPVASGTAITNDGEYVYVLRGSGSTDAYFYLPPEGPDPNPGQNKFPFPSPLPGQWVKFGSETVRITVPINRGAGIVHVGKPLSQGAGSTTDPLRGRLFALAGGDSKSFIFYDTGVGRWVSRSGAPENVNNGGALAYKPGDNYIYAVRGSMYWWEDNYHGTNTVWRYRIETDANGSGNTWDTSPQNVPQDEVGNIPAFCRSSDIWYPGSGDYVYAQGLHRTYTPPYYSTGIHPGRGFFRFGPLGSSATWQRLDDAPASTNSEGFIIYDPDGTQNEIHLLSTRNFTRPWRYSLTSNHWITLSQAPYDSHQGISICYPGSGDYIYYAAGNGTWFYRYSIAQNKWEQLKNIPYSIYYHGNRLTYLDGYIYCLQGNNQSGFYRYDISQDPYQRGDIWEVLGQSRNPDSTGDPAAFPYYDDNFTDTDTSNKVNYGSGIVGANTGTKKYIYALRGTDTNHFYRIEVTLDIENNTWQQMPSIPSITRGGYMQVAPGRDKTDGKTYTYIYAAPGRYSKKIYRYGPLEDDDNRTGDDINGDGYTGAKWETLAAEAAHIFDYYYGATISYDGGNYLYTCTGANDNYGYSYQFGRYNIYTESPETLEPTPFNQTYSDRTFAAGALYSVNYYGDNNFWKYDPSSGTWNEPVVDIFGNQAGNLVMDNNNNIYLVYGNPEFNLSSHIWKYSPVDKAWTGLIRAPFVLSNGTKGAYLSDTNSIYITKGRTSKDFYKYNLSNKKWSEASPLSSECWRNTQLTAGTHAWHVGNVIYALCKGDTSGESTFYVYDSSDSWAAYKVAPTSFSQYGDAMTFMNGKVYLMALGSSGFYEYVPDGWVSRTPVGDTGAGTGAILTGSGAGLYYPGSGEYLYCVPVENYDHFIKYKSDGSGGSWTQLNSLPQRPNWCITGMISPVPGRIYVFNYAFGNTFIRYDITKNIWDELTYLPDQMYAGATLCGYQGYIYYLRAGDRSFRRYNTTDDTWEDLATANSEFTNWDVCMLPVEYNGQLSIYVTEGKDRTGFYRYDIPTDTWYTLNNPTQINSANEWEHGNSIAQVGRYIYALRGESKTMWKYDMQTGTWQVEKKGTIPVAVTEDVSRGGDMVYPGTGNLIYVLVGGMKQSFYSYNVQTQSFNLLSSCIVTVNDSKSRMIYPGFGDYIYYLQGASYWSSDESYTMLRYSIRDNKWEELTPSSFGIDKPGTLAYAGDEYFYVAKGYGRNNFTKYYAFNFGDYISEVTEVDKHSGWGLINWQDNGLQSVDVGVRTGNDADFAGNDIKDALDWGMVINMVSGSDISSSSAVNDTDKYIQYRVIFGTDNLDEIPVLNSVDINWEKYPVTSQNLISKPFNTSLNKNRIMNLTWDETLPPGTDIRFQLRTSPDGQNWNGWAGPGGTQAFNYRFADNQMYMADSHVKVTPGMPGTVQLYKELEDFRRSQKLVFNNMGGAAITATQLVFLEINSSNQDFWDNIGPGGSDLRFHDGTRKLRYCLLYFDPAAKTAGVNVELFATSLEPIPANSIKNVWMVYKSEGAPSESVEDLREYKKFKNDSYLFAWWEFEEGSGNTVIDGAPGLAGTNVLSFVHEPDWIIGDGLRGSNAVNLDGILECLRAQTASSYFTYKGEGKTFSIWLRPDAADTNGGYIVTNTWPYNFFIYLRSDRRVIVGLRNRGSAGTGPYWERTTTGSIASDRKWHNLVVVIRPDNAPAKAKAVEVYFDGLRADSNWTHDINGWNNVYFSRELLLGNVHPYDYTGSRDYYYWGGMDFCAFFNRDLSAEEVVQFYRGSSDQKIYFAVNEESVPPANPLSAWAYRLPIRVDNATGANINGAIAIIRIGEWFPFWAHVKNNGGDVRFVDSDGQTLLSYYLAPNAFDYSNKTALAYVQLDIPNGGKDIYVYYGNGAALDASNKAILGMPKKDQIVAWWRFDEGSGSKVKDISGGSKRGSFIGGDPVWSSGKIGKAILFDGVDDYVEIKLEDYAGAGTTSPYWQSIFSDGTWSISAWVYTQFSFSGTEANILDVAGYRPRINLNMSNCKISAYNTSSVYTDLVEYSSSNYFLNAWHHIAVVCNGTGQDYRLYIDGVLKDTTSYQNFPSNTVMQEPVIPLTMKDIRIGWEGLGGTNIFFKGLIDEVVFYNTSLTQSDINQIVNLPTTINYIEGLSTFPAKPAEENTFNTGNFYEDNPVILPIYGVFYDAVNRINSFSESSSKPSGSDIGYQISPEGFHWYYWDGSDWTEADGAYLGGFTNTAAEVNAYLTQFQNKFTPGEFLWRAYLHSDDGSRTPQLTAVDIVVSGPSTYYIDATGVTEAITSGHSDSTGDRWIQYKATLYSSGENTPVLNKVEIQYVEPKITITTPNPIFPEEWAIGSLHDIYWTSEGLEDTTGGVIIKYWSDDNNNWKDVINGIADDGEYEWTIPDDPSTSSQVKIVSKDIPAIESAPVNLIIKGLRVTSPNGGIKGTPDMEIWEASYLHYIKWTDFGVRNNSVSLKYTVTGQTPKTIASGIAPGQPVYGNLPWTIPANLEANEVIIEIQDQVDSDVTDKSDYTFSVVPPPIITITSPVNTGTPEEWIVDEEYVITWTTNSQQFGENFVLEFSTDNGATWPYTEDPIINAAYKIATVPSGAPLYPTLPNTDLSLSYTWRIPASSIFISDTVKIRISEELPPANRDTKTVVSAASATFKIVGPTINMVQPAGGEVWVTGDDMQIKWTTQGNVGSVVKIWYSTDDFTTVFEPVTDNAATANNSYSWSVPPITDNPATPAINETKNVKVRIEDKGNIDTFAVSTDYFEIIPQAVVTIAGPDGGEEITVGVPYPITWDTIGRYAAETANYKLYYSAVANPGDPDVWVEISGASFQMNDPGTNHGSFTWDPDVVSDYVKVKIECMDTVGHGYLKDTSNAYFKVSKPTLIIDSPAQGDAWYATGNYNITWTPEGSISNDLTIEYSIDGGSWVLLPNPTPAQVEARSYPWSVEDRVGSIARIRINDNYWLNAGYEVRAVSGEFTIIEPKITVLSPTSDDRGVNAWVIGETNPISWKTEGGAVVAIRNLTIQYATVAAPTDGDFKPIANITSQGVIAASDNDNPAQYIDWTVPDNEIPSATVSVRIFDSTRPVTKGLSETFEFAAPSLVVEFPPPPPGEKWIMGTTHTITWYSRGAIVEPVKIFYNLGTIGAQWVEITTDAVGAPFDGLNDGELEWRLPDEYSPGLARVKIQDSHLGLTGQPEPRFFTTSPFTIDYPKITLNNPGLIAATDTITVAWSVDGELIGPLVLDYSIDGFNVNIGNISNSIDGTARMQTWSNIPMAAVGGNVTLRLVDSQRTQSSAFTTSFRVLPPPNVTITSPTAADSGLNALRMGGTYAITWQETPYVNAIGEAIKGSLSNDLRVEYSTDGGVSWTPYATGNVANTGTFNWRVPILNGPYTDCKVRLYDNKKWKTNTNYSAASEEFTIDIPTIDVTYPQDSPSIGKISWATGEKPVIEWSHEGTVSNNLVIQLITPDGVTVVPTAGVVGESGKLEWTDGIPLMNPTNNAKIKIIDMGQQYNTVPTYVEAESDVFNIISAPTLQIIAPSGGEYVLGDSVAIKWKSLGALGSAQSPNIPVKIEYSNDNFASSIDTISTSTASAPNGETIFNWNILEDPPPLTGPNVRIKVSMVDRPEVFAISNPFRVRGGFEITRPSQTEARLISNKPENITWKTKGTISEVVVKFTLDKALPLASWSIIYDGPNNGAVTYTMPLIDVADIPWQTAMIRVENKADPTVFVEAKPFVIDYYTIEWQVMDADYATPLDQLKTKDNKDYWVDWTDEGIPGNINQPIQHDYPYGNYITYWSREGYIQNSTEWTPNGDEVKTVMLENKATTMMEWHVLISTSYNAETNELNASAWLEKKGRLVIPINLGNATLRVYDGMDPDAPGTVLKWEDTETEHDEQGVFWFNWSDTTLEAGKTYFVEATIWYLTNDYVSGSSIDVTAAVENYEQSQQLEDLSATADDIKTAVEESIPLAIEDAKAEIKRDTAKITQDTGDILIATTTTLPAQILETKDRVEISMKSSILNRESIIQKGKSLMIRYRTNIGTDVTVDVYKPNGEHVIAITADQIGDTEIYEAEVTFESEWGIGDFTIVCSDSLYGTMDALIITVLLTDLEAMASKVSSISGTAANLTSIRDSIDAMGAQFDIIESMFGIIGKTSEEQLESDSDMKVLVQQLNKMSQNIKSMQAAVSKGLDLTPLYEFKEEQKSDMKDLKNNTLRMMATVELSQKLLDNVANEPVQQEWYEWRSVVLKSMVVNPSETQKREIPFKTYLPKEAKPEHIINRGDLNIAFDTQQGSYYVFATFVLEPKEVKEVEIEMKDIWQIKADEIESLRQEANKVCDMLKFTEFSSRAEFLLINIDNNLNAIVEKQKVRPLNPADHISNYRENIELMKEAKADLALARALLSQVKPFSLKAAWKLILAIVVFLGVLSAGFYFVWQKQVKLGELPTIEGEDTK